MLTEFQLYAEIFTTFLNKKICRPNGLMFLCFFNWACLCSSNFQKRNIDCTTKPWRVLIAVETSVETKKKRKRNVGSAWMIYNTYGFSMQREQTQFKWVNAGERQFLFRMPSGAKRGRECKLSRVMKRKHCHVWFSDR